LPLVGLIAARLQPAVGLPGMIAGGPVQGVVFLAILVPWAALVDRRPLSDYGVTASRRWLADLAVALLAVWVVWTAWHLLAARLGWFDLAAGPAVTGDGVAGVVGVLVSLGINTWVQDVVFFAIVLAVAAEGFHARGVGRRRAVLGGWSVGALFFTAIHGTPTAIDAASTALGGAVFGLLYVHTGDLAATIGVHSGSSVAAGTLFADPERARAVVHVTGSVPGVDAVAPALVLYPVTYLLLVGWLRLSRGSVGVDPSLATWTRRPAGRAGTRGE
jgi:membrane protease YdiL (CAAX protease family)